MFSEFWIKYPRKVAKRAAEKAYDKAVKQYPHSAIMASLETMLQTEWRGRGIDYLPHAATFLNRETFDEQRPTQMPMEELEEPWEMPLAHKHWCTAHGHAWDCTETPCISPTFAWCESGAETKPKESVKVSAT